MDYKKLYHLEHYLFNEVHRKFEKDKNLSAFDFFCIIIWKAERSKSKIAKRLHDKQEEFGCKDLDCIVKKLLELIDKAGDNKERMRILIDDWKLRLPMASAILTVLYPKSFTVYDKRVCEVIEFEYNIKDRQKFESIWTGYKEYMDEVNKNAPEGSSLRDSDRYLWGKSFSKQLKYNIDNQFDIGNKKL